IKTIVRDLVECYARPVPYFVFILRFVQSLLLKIDLNIVLVFYKNHSLNVIVEHDLLETLQGDFLDSIVFVEEEYPKNHSGQYDYHPDLIIGLVRIGRIWNEVLLFIIRYFCHYY